MSSKFPESGLAAVLELSQWSKNVTQYVKDVDRMNKADEASVKATDQASKKLDLYARSLQKIAQTARQASKDLQPKSGKTLADLIPSGITEKLNSFTGGIGQLVGKLNFLPAPLQAGIQGIGGLTSSLGGALGGISLVTAGVTVAAAAFVALGMRGAAMPGIIQAFDISAAKAGTLSSVLLGDLRSASVGTVSDMQLMTTANVALAGASGQVAEALGKGGGLAGLMEIARAQAKATGKDVDFLFDSLVTGVKRSTPMLIDNTGLVLKVGEANEAYAKSVGKSVSALSAEEKQIALLNATLAAGQAAVETYGSGPLNAAERIAQIQTTITNVLDKASIAVQPLFNLILAIGKTLLDVLIWPLSAVLLPLVYEISNAIFGPLTAAWEGLTAGLSNLFAPVAQLVHRWLTLIVAGVRLFGKAFQWLVKQIGALLSPVANVIKTYLVKPITTFLDPAQFAKRAGNVFGAFAEGILWAANTLIFPAVIGIAEFIRDFLMGFSPPEKGPLSTIDEGGANLATAWLEGFTGVSLSPVEAMAAAVNSSLGSIGDLSYDQVQARLAVLDEAVQPFIDNLNIAKARLEELTTPLEAAADAVEEKLNGTVKDFFAGTATAEQVRALDLQNEAISTQLGLVEDMSSEAEYQLSMVQSRQAVERALLGIQAARTKQDQAASQAAKETADASSSAASKAASTGSGEDETSSTTGSSTGWEDLTQSDPVGSFMGVTDEDISALWGDMQTGFTEGFMSEGVSSQLADFNANKSQLSSVFGEISSTSAFQGLTSTINNVFGDGEGSIRNKVGGFIDDVKTWFTVDLPNTFANFSLTDTVTKWSNAWQYPTGSIWTTLNGFVTGIGTFVTEDIPNKLSSFSLTGVIDKFKDAFFYDTSGAKQQLRGFRDYISNFFNPDGGTLISFIDDFSLEGLLNLFNEYFNLEDGKVWAALSAFGGFIKNFFTNGAGGVFFDALGNVGTMLITLFGAPIQGILNAVLDGFRLLVNGMIDLINGFIGKYNGSFAADILGHLDTIGKVEEGEWHIDVIPDIPSAASGGFVGGGIAKVHQGETLVSSSSPFTVFPARWVKAMESLADQVATWRPMAAQSAAPVVLDGRGDLTVQQTFNGRTDASDMQRTIYELRARGVLA